MENRANSGEPSLRSLRRRVILSQARRPFGERREGAETRASARTPGEMLVPGEAPDALARGDAGRAKR
jgi:hypothetical protein